MVEVTHMRLVSFTKKFHDTLLSMGFTINSKTPNSLEFIKKDSRYKKVISSMSGMTLSYKLNYDWSVAYEGLTINLSLLEFFSEKDPLLSTK